MPAPIRVLTAVPICDGHDSAINTINLEFIRHGIEVVYLGYHRYAKDIVRFEVMRHFGFERFALCGHDRGGRVGYRMALDYPRVVTKLAVLDIVPTWEAFSRADMEIEDPGGWQVQSPASLFDIQIKRMHRQLLQQAGGVHARAAHRPERWPNFQRTGSASSRSLFGSVCASGRAV